MPELIYPVTCHSCSKPQFGPVTYCPYCKAQEVAVPGSSMDKAGTRTQVQEPPKAEAAEIPASLAENAASPPAGKTTPEIKNTKPVVAPNTEVKAAIPVVPITPAAPVSAATTPAPAKPGKWIAVAVVLTVGFAGYLLLHKRGDNAQDPSGSQQSSAPTAPSSTSTASTQERGQGQGKKDSARIVAQDALRKGTDLSLTISKIPKLEKVLEAAKQLGDISPRYQDQVASAESTVSAARSELNRGVLAYIGKTAELDRYTQEQKSYAMEVVLKGDLAPREKIVAELLQKHVSASQTSSKSEPKIILKGFTSQFKDFND